MSKDFIYSFSLTWLYTSWKMDFALMFYKKCQIYILPAHINKSIVVSVSTFLYLILESNIISIQLVFNTFVFFFFIFFFSSSSLTKKKKEKIKFLPTLSLCSQISQHTDYQQL